MTGSRKHVAVIAAVAAVLAVAVVVLAQVNRSDTVVEQGSIAITRGGRTLKVFTMAQVKALPCVRAEKTILSSSHADEHGAFTGVPLRTLLGEISPTLAASATQIVTRAVDGYVSSLSADEVSADDTVLLVYAKDGQSLGTFKNGGTGPFRIVILGDRFGNRCTKWVNEIELR